MSNHAKDTLDYGDERLDVRIYRLLSYTGVFHHFWGIIHAFTSIRDGSGNPNDRYKDRE